MGSSAATQEKIQERLDFVRTCLAHGMYDHEVLTACEASDRFMVAEGSAESPGATIRRMARKTIRRYYLYRVKKEVRETKHDSQDEFGLACERILAAFRVAALRKPEQGGPDSLGMVRAQRELNRMMGLRRRESPMQPVDDEFLQDQQDEMDDLMGGTDG